MHYHKTGCILSINLFRFFSSVLNGQLSVKKNPITKGRVFKYDKNGKMVFDRLALNMRNKYNVYNQAGPNFFVDLPQVDQIVHFVRESYDHCISNYLYHVQYPTPESWFLKVPTDIDQWYNERELFFMANDIGLSNDVIVNLFEYLKRVYDCPSDMRYYDYLRSLSKEKGVVIETIRFILTVRDPLRMAMMANRLGGMKHTRTVRMKDFKEGVVDQTISDMGQFLFGNDMTDEKTTSVINKYKMNYQSAKKGSHVTNNKITKEEKNELINVLMGVGPISIILDIVNQTVMGDGVE